MHRIAQILSTFLLILHVSSNTPQDNPFFVYYTVTNPTQTPVRFYKLESPFGQTFHADYLLVKFHGRDLDRRRRPLIYRRRCQEPSIVSDLEFGLLKPGESATISIDLGNQFIFKEAGTYEVEIVPLLPFYLQDRIDSGELIVEECLDRERNYIRRYLQYEICGRDFVSQAQVREEFTRNFIRKSESPIELHASLTLNDPTEKRIEAKINENPSKDVPVFGTFGSASLVINITLDNIPYSNSKYRYSDYCKCWDHPFGIWNENLEEEEKKGFEEKECPGFSIWKYRKAFDDGLEIAKRKILDDMEPFVIIIYRIFILLRGMFRKYLAEYF